MPRSPDVIIVGAGHNGLVAAIILGRHGLAVTVLEANSVAGGLRERNFRSPGHPGLARPLVRTSWD
jgi:phytoene dehydrogenase-like protein